MKILNAAFLLGLACISQGSIASEKPPIKANWVDYESLISPWKTVKGPINCTNWSPPTSSIVKGVSFLQTATDCIVEQDRSVQHRVKNNQTYEIKNAGEPQWESRTIAAKNSKQAIGIKEQWTPIAPKYGQWVNSGNPYNCGAWTPSASTILDNKTFQQTASCLIDQTRMRTNLDQEKQTQAIRESGNPVYEKRTVSNQNNSRLYTVKFSDWANTGNFDNCTEWSPRASNIPAGSTFQQTQTCTTLQARTVSGYVGGSSGLDPAFPAKTQTRSVANDKRTQLAVGTMTEECRYDLTSGITSNFSKQNTSYLITWAGAKIYYSEAAQSDRQTVNGGYVYTRGILKSEKATTSIWEVCRHKTQ
jgi:hypothetical protein